MPEGAGFHAAGGEEHSVPAGSDGGNPQGRERTGNGTGVPALAANEEGPANNRRSGRLLPPAPDKLPRRARPEDADAAEKARQECEEFAGSAGQVCRIS
ncbi:hypothetical protein ON010_g14677 [Phytophthora cinnamomi]|nr:hypothetical protein ON010_g14677 [Phytophthora cinnamomi]